MKFSFVRGFSFITRDTFIESLQFKLSKIKYLSQVT